MVLPSWRLRADNTTKNPSPSAESFSKREDLERIMKDLKAQGTRTMPAGGSPASGNPPGSNPPGSSNPARPTGLTTEIQARIGHQLRAMYDEVVRQGVPDRFATLIRKLDDPDTPKAGGSETDGGA
jgi:hypothetical protein